jgi:uncharacterized protein (DUF2062 family)
VTIWYIGFPKWETAPGILSRSTRLRPVGCFRSPPFLAFFLLAEMDVKPWLINYFLRRLPTPDSIRESWLFAFYGPRLLRSEYWQPRRHSLALGIGLGWLIGLLPCFGIQGHLALLVGTWIRCHLPSAVLGTFLSNPFTLPGILALQYLAGRWLQTLAGFHPVTVGGLGGFLLHHGVPFLMGAVASAVLAGLLGTAGIWMVLGWWERRMVGRVV